MSKRSKEVLVEDILPTVKSEMLKSLTDLDYRITPYGLTLLEMTCKFIYKSVHFEVSAREGLPSKVEDILE